MTSEKAWSPFNLQGQKKALLPDFALFVTLLGAGFYLWRAAAGLPEYDWNWDLLADFFVLKSRDGYKPGLLLSGLFTTLRVGFWTTLFALSVGWFFGALGARASLAIFAPVQLYVNVFRNTPPLVILFAIYLFAGQFFPARLFEDFARTLSPGLSAFFSAVFAGPAQLDRMISAVIALGLYQGAYVTEIVRGSLASVNVGQWEAAQSLGFNRRQTLRLIILPQALRLALPPLVTQTIIIFKDTALVSLVSLPDLTFQSLEIMAISSMTFEIWISAGLIYLLLSGFFSVLGYAAQRFFSPGSVQGS